MSGDRLISEEEYQYLVQKYSSGQTLSDREIRLVQIYHFYQSKNTSVHNQTPVPKEKTPKLSNDEIKRKYDLLWLKTVDGEILTPEEKVFMKNYEDEVARKESSGFGNGKVLALRTENKNDNIISEYVLDPEEIPEKSAAFIKASTIIIIVICVILFLIGFCLDIFS